MAVDPWSRNTYQLPSIPKYAISRHVRRHTSNDCCDKGIIAIEVNHEWYLLLFATGRRLLSALPFFNIKDGPQYLANFNAIS